MGVSYEILRCGDVPEGPEKLILKLSWKALERELLVNVKDWCKATWIALDDCLGTAREMRVVVKEGTGPRKPSAKRKRERGDGEREGENEDVQMEDAEGEG
ncbi:MOZ/SAS family protein [Colletotrichum plurivorum]|uniref:MOZ/SAS family protein n=1 Tax=Colletotrichum plurivorum TaxID=2175906 RepID=A0A8H6NBN9_9PEZI|nr:MOZ/SAS family protein [Colletotrichum plurivorum]